MIVILPGTVTVEALDACLVLAAQLDTAGHVVALDDRALPAEMPRSQKYDAAPFLTSINHASVTRLLLVASAPLSPPIADLVRGYSLGPDARIDLCGRFPDAQARIATLNSVAYAAGGEPRLLDLDTLFGPALLPGTVGPLAVPMRKRAEPRGQPVLLILCSGNRLSDPGVNAALRQLAYHGGFRLRIATHGSPPDDIARAALHDCPPEHLGDLPAEALAAHVHLAAILGEADEGTRSDRLAAVTMALMGAGKPVIDCTPAHSLAATGAPVLRGPTDIESLGSYLSGSVLPNLTEVGRFVAASPWLSRRTFEALSETLALPPADRPSPSDEPVTLFMPTNGVGLGHAQRCCIIASEMASDQRVEFAAFPSCLPLARRHGFAGMPLVPKSADHPEPFANDLVNYLRLRRKLRDGDRFVFDGGYVFQSIIRVIHERDVRPVWIRRGLWQPSPQNDRAIERGRFFPHTILPQEAFDELNTPAGFGSSDKTVGPIVRALSASAPTPEMVRLALAERFARPFRELAVTMLGAGVAADRTAHLQALASLYEQRRDCLHLIVTWPGATIPPALTTWTNTRVVRSYDGLSLLRAADIVVSAAGYNSFHEILYHRIPAVFVPQMAPFMDDQNRRARAAAERGLARVVAPDDVLMLTREVAGLMEDGRSSDLRMALARQSLPEPGNGAAARLIEELT